MSYYDFLTPKELAQFSSQHVCDLAQGKPVANGFHLYLGNFWVEAASFHFDAHNATATEENSPSWDGPCFQLQNGPVCQVFVKA